MNFWEMPKTIKGLLTAILLELRSIDRHLEYLGNKARDRNYR